MQTWYEIYWRDPKTRLLESYGVTCGEAAAFKMLEQAEMEYPGCLWRMRESDDGFDQEWDRED